VVNIKKLLAGGAAPPPTDPIAIFDSLDKESGKEYFRPPQKSVLEAWYKEHMNDKDLIIKLHTGQGKTLIGLLILQSYLNAGSGPALYICPNKYLSAQIIEQASEFGIKTVQFEDRELPQDFTNSKAILVINCSKLFNGLSAFGVQGGRKEPIEVGAIVMDDAHKCLEIVRQSFSVSLRRKLEDNFDNSIYDELLSLFEPELERQRAGTLSDIKKGDYGLMAVPYWTFYEKRKDVLRILSNNKDHDDIKFSWNLIKDQIDRCTCVFAEDGLEISPRLLPIDKIPTFANSAHRIFLSATLNEDAFLIRDLGLDPESVKNPLSIGDVKYSGERLILIPSLMNVNIRRDQTISWVVDLAKKNGNFGVVSITPSFTLSRDWQKKGAMVANKDNIFQSISDYKSTVDKGRATFPLVLVNQYDGVDLPDKACRILCLDSSPSYDNLFDRYMYQVRTNSISSRRRIAQRIEQGMGRGIRGSSDWCIVVATGAFLTNYLSENSKRAFLSKETQMQLQIGEIMAEEMKEEGGTVKVMEGLVNQCLSRDDAWKQFYKKKMETVEVESPRQPYIDLAVRERRAEKLHQQGKIEEAVQEIRPLVVDQSNSDKGWYLQLIATYLYPVDPARAMEAQSSAFVENDKLFAPQVRLQYSKLNINYSRASMIIKWISQYENSKSMILRLQIVTDDLNFGSGVENFEEAMKSLGLALGFGSQRPEKENHVGPDNLWNMPPNQYWIIQCKNDVSGDRTTISTREIDQLSGSVGWFNDTYKRGEFFPIIVHPSHVLAHGAFAAFPSWVLDNQGLQRIKDNLMTFYSSIASRDLKDLDEKYINEQLKVNHLESENLVRNYLQRIERVN
jgi:replicative superfamily II helicase